MDDAMHTGAALFRLGPVAVTDTVTDRQIYLDQKLFAGGFRPAIDVALSVSRIGGKAQHPRIKEEAGRMCKCRRKTAIICRDSLPEEVLHRSPRQRLSG